MLNQLRSWFHDYQSCPEHMIDNWDIIYKGLESPEPFLRLFTLQGLTGIHVKSIAQPERLIHRLCSMASEDSLSVRCLACWVLAQVALKTESIGLQKICLDVILSNFSLSFPTEAIEPIQFDMLTPITTGLLNARVQLLEALSTLFSLPVCHDYDLSSYLDGLFASILSVNSHPMLTAATIRSINRLPLTNRNRLRVENLRPLIISRMEAYVERRQGSFFPTLEPIHPHLLKAFNSFFSKWFNVPSDEILLSLDTCKDGYAYRKRALLSKDITEYDDVSRQKALTKKVLPYPKKQPKLDASMFSRFVPSLPPFQVVDIDTSNIKFQPVLFPGNDFKFSLKPPTMRFTAPGYLKTYLENTCQEDMGFSIQVYPPEYFTATPSVGVLGKLESVQITVKYHPKPFTKLFGDIRGYIRVRNMDGFPMDRISLIGYNLPAVKVFPSSLDFGVCPANESRSLNLSLTNLLDSEVYVVAVSKHSVFSVQSSQVLLPPKEQKIFAIKASPSVTGRMEDEIILAINGWEIMHVKVKVDCGEALQVLQKYIDFGPTDIFYAPVQRRLDLVNHSRFPLPISFDPSSDEILVNFGRQVTLGPFESRTVRVDFKSKLLGQRSESIRIDAPHSGSTILPITTYCGPLLLIPFRQEIFFPCTLIGVKTSIELPITNPTSDVMTFKLIAKNVEFELLPYEKYNRITGQVDAFTSEEDQGKALNVTLDSKMTAVISIEFVASLEGCFRFPLTTVGISPKEFTMQHYLNVVVGKGEESFFKKPFHVGTVEPAEYDHNVEPAFQETGIELSPSYLMVYGSSRSRPRQDWQFVTIDNQLDEAVPFSLLISYQFMTDVDLQGTLPPKSKVDIPIRVDPMLYAEDETLAQGVLGTMQVITEKGTFSCQLHGVFGDLIRTESRLNTDKVKFQSCKLLEYRARRFFVRNTSPVELTVQTSCKSDFNCFTVSTPKVSFKPFEYIPIDISFTSNTMGLISSTMEMSFTDPHPRLGGGSSEVRRLVTWVFECFVGQPLVTIPTTFLDFGHVSFKEKKQLNFSVRNGEKAEAIVQTASSTLKMKPFKIAANQQTDVDVSFEPHKVGPLSEIISFSIQGDTFNVPVIGYGGEFSMKCHPLQLSSMNESAEERKFLDVGMVSAACPKTESLFIKNTGSLDFMVHQISIGNDLLASCTILDEYNSSEVPSELLFGAESPDLLEVDWDNEDVIEEKSIIKLESTQIKSFASNINLPVRLTPSASIRINLRFGHTLVGLAKTVIKVDISRSNVKTTYGWWVQGNIQPSLSVHDKRLDFGVVPLGHRPSLQLKFSNPGTIPLPWQLVNGGTEWVPTKYHHLPLSDNMAEPITFYPSKGTLKPGAVQTVAVTFSPYMAQYEVHSILKLLTSDIAVTPIHVHGTCASTVLVVDTKSIKFDVERVGTEKEKSFTISNHGALACSFFIHSSHPAFLVVPEQIYLQAGQSSSVKCIYAPKLPGTFEGHIIIEPIESLVKPESIPISGIASYPDISVHTRMIDYEIALFQHKNRRSLEVENKGPAEAHVIFKCFHPDIYLEEDSGNGFTIPPFSKRQCTLTFLPTKVEILDTKIYLRSSDSRGDNFLIYVKGRVGIPKMILDPIDSLSHLDYGVVRVGKTAKKSFKVLNDGNIYCNYRSEITATSMVHLEIGQAKPVGRFAANVPCPVLIEPESARLEAGQSITVTISFTPKAVVDFEYQIVLTNDFQTYKGVLKGVGGKAFLILDSPNDEYDFGICRLGKLYRMPIHIYSKGNLACTYHVRPEPANGDWGVYDQDVVEFENDFETNQVSIGSTQWIEELKPFGLVIKQPQGYLATGQHATMEIEFKATESPLKKTFRVYYGSHFTTFTLFASSSSPKVYLLDSTSQLTYYESSKFDITLGIRPVDKVTTRVIQVMNESKFGIDVLVQPMAASQYDVYPLHGYIPPLSSLPVNVYFKPDSENTFHTRLKLLWEGESISVPIVGQGGIGRLELFHSEDQDFVNRGMNFGLIPLNGKVEKKIFVMNAGLVDITVSMDTDNHQFSIMQLETIPMSEVENYPTIKQGVIMNYNNSLKVVVPPQTAIGVAVCFTAYQEDVTMCGLTVRSEQASYVIPLRGKGGTLKLTHEGDLEFGDITCCHTYSRKVKIINNGSIPAKLNFKWSLVGQASSNDNRVILVPSYNPMDPRSGWAKNMLSLSDTKTAKDYWNMIKVTLLSKFGKQDPFFDKRKTKLFELVKSAAVTYQSNDMIEPFIEVDQASMLVPAFESISVTVNIHLAKEQTFLATLIVKPDVPCTNDYQINCSATPKLVNICVSDTRMLNFYRQALGQSETINRFFTNIGSTDVRFKLSHSNEGLTISPSQGLLKVGGSVNIAFTFSPTEEAARTGDVLLDTFVSPPLRLKMFGGGGFLKCSLSKVKTFDFGPCMLRKRTDAYLSIVNEGTAVLKLLKFSLKENETYFKGKDWPTSPIRLLPDQNYRLPLIFYPLEEMPLPTMLKIDTNGDTYEVELFGTGKESVLIVSKLAFEFKDCIIGNTYSEKFFLKNVGEVNYPVELHLPPEFSISETSFTIPPFTQVDLTLVYTPKTAATSIVHASIESPYSTHKLDISVHAGPVHLVFDKEMLDFGFFEKSNTTTLNITNTGTVECQFWFDIPDFVVVPKKGVFLPQVSTPITVTHTGNFLGKFVQDLIIHTNMAHKKHSIPLIGQCEMSVLQPDEFNNFNMGICAVADPITKVLTFKNHGKYPLTFTVKSTFPLTVEPEGGVCKGEDTFSLTISWCPSGAFELRSQIMLLTNVGSYPISIKGKSLTPDVTVDKMFIDYGIVNVGTTYTEVLMLENKGKVPATFHVPSIPNVTTHVKNGRIQPKTTFPLQISVLASQMERISVSLIIEIKGAHYKEIGIAAVGGTLNLVPIPDKFEFGECPFAFRKDVHLVLKNVGDVPAFVDFVSGDTGDFDVMNPTETTLIPASTSTTFKLGVLVKVKGEAKGHIYFKTKEKSFSIPIAGLGEKIELSKKSQKMFDAGLPILQRELDSFLDDWFETAIYKSSEGFNKDFWMSHILGKLKFSSRDRDVLSLDFNKLNNQEKRAELMSILQEPVEGMNVNDLWMHFINIKNSEYKPKPLVDIPQQVISAGKFTVEQIELDQVLCYVEPVTEEDLSLITSRPPALPNDLLRVAHKLKNYDHRLMDIDQKPAIKNPPFKGHYSYPPGVNLYLP